MKPVRSFLCILLILGLLLPGIPNTRAADANSIIRQLIIYYTHHQENARTDIERLLQDLEALDPEQSAQWREIIHYWHYACTELPASPEILPDGLPQDDSLCIVVFGFALNYDGTPQAELEGRLNTALASAEKYPNAYILCTGGGTAPGNPYATEAGRMAKWLQEHGIAPERIIKEDRSYSTEQNAMFCLEILRRDYPQIRSLALVSSDYHLRRCHLLFQALLILNNLTQQYEIAASAAYAAGYVGECGYAWEAEGLGFLVGMRIRGTGAPTLSVLTSLSAEGSQTHVLGEPLSIKVSAHYNSGFSRDVTADAQISGYDPNTPGDQDITVTYTENGASASCTLTVTITNPPTQPPTEPATEAPATEPNVPVTEPPSEESIKQTPGWLVWVLIPLVASLPLLIFLVSYKRPRGKYEKRG